ncbi:MAG: C10 family peptidase [Kiritimatiellia bacterium]
MTRKFTVQFRPADVFRVAWAVMGIVLGASGALLTEGDALDRLSIWMDGHPVMGGVAGSAIESTVAFPQHGSAYDVYVVAFSPVGYAVLNSDDRLPLVVAFSASSSVGLEDRPGNAFRAALLTHVEQAALALSGKAAKAAPDRSYLRAVPRGLAGIEQHGPYLTTAWSQWNPYNLFCPDDPNGNDLYQFRAPSGCTPTAYAQVLYYHRWPIHGQGTHTYADSSGSITGAHTADFRTPFDWAAMQLAYNPWTDTQPGDVAVADLMYRLGVAADADYENGGTSSSIETLGCRLDAHLFYEPVTCSGSQAELLPRLNESLRAGWPCVVAVPGHAIVADGLLDDNGTVSYHINYGWGGDNNGWWSADNVAGEAIASGCTSLKPALMAFPTDETVQAVVGEPATLEWLLPSRREQEAGRILLHRLTPQSNAWSSAAETLAHAVSSGWALESGGRTGSCWFTGPNGHSALTLTDVFVPDASSTLTFWMQYRLGTATFRVAVSSDGGNTYTNVFERNDNYPLNWAPCTVDLGAFAGEQIRIRFELTRGSYYPDTGGVWLDDLGITSGSWWRWVPFIEDTTLAVHRFSEQRTLLDDCADFSNFEATSTSSYKDWVVSTASGVDHCFYKEPGGYSNREYHLTARAPVVPGAGTRLLMRWKRSLASDCLRVMVSSDRSTFTEIWRTGGSSGWVEQSIPLGACAGQPIYLRLEYMVESYYTDGGVWIDALWLQEVENPELEGQPVHFTTMTAPLEIGSYILASVVEDTNATSHVLSPAFTLNVLPPFDCRLEPGGGVMLTRCNSRAERLEIPSEWAGQPVTGIASNAFAGTPVVSLILPASITTIEAGAFADADALERLFFTGHAPAVAADELAGSVATVYYLPGMSGWSSSFGGRLALLWNPTPAPGAGFGFQNGVFGFTLTGTALIPVHVQAASDLTSSAWSSITNAALDAAGTLQVRDPESPAHIRRFYRCVWP